MLVGIEDMLVRLTSRANYAPRLHRLRIEGTLEEGDERAPWPSPHGQSEAPPIGQVEGDSIPTGPYGRRPIAVRG
jgi:hypothetical protein